MHTTPVERDFIPLEAGRGGGRGTTTGPGHHLYNRTKRKRESSSRTEDPGGGGGTGNNNNGQGADNNHNPSPWIRPGKTYTQNIVGLHEEIEDFFRWMVPTPEEHSLRLAVVDRIGGAVNGLWPRAKVEIFGSFRTGLYLPTSDIDLVIFGDWSDLPLRTLEQALLARGIADPDTLKVLDKAAVPIVKMKDKLTGVRVDISFNMDTGLRAAELVKLFKRKYPPLPKLIYVLKQFLLQRDLNEVFTGGLSSYALILMVVSFLQLHCRGSQASNSNANLGVLLVEFFETYGRHFNYAKSAIRVNDEGSLISKEEVQRRNPEGFRSSIVCIEDPLDPTNDVGKSSYGAMSAKQSFERAYVDLVRVVRPGASALPSGKSILSQIIQVSQEAESFRKWAKLSQDLCTGEELLSSPTGSSSEFPLPRGSSSTPAAGAEPKELPDRHWKAEDAANLMPPPPPPPQPPTTKIGSNKDVDSNGDNLSNVSSGTSGVVTSTNSSPPSSSSSSQSGSDDTDSVSDLVVGDHATPTSAMSISPANSEVGSIKSHLISRSVAPVAASSRLSAIFKQQPSPSSSSKDKPRANYWGIGRSSNRDGPDRADLDRNWRVSSAANNAVPKNNDDPTRRGNNKKGSSTSVTGASAASASLVTASDQDTNWRDHEQPKREESGSPKNVWKNKKSKRYSANRKSAADKVDNNPLVSAVSSSPPSTTSSEMTPSAKDRLTAGLIVSTNDNEAVSSNQNNNLDNSPSPPPTAASPSSGEKSKRTSKKRKKRHNIGGGSAASSVNDDNDSGVGLSRFSRRTGQFRPDR